MEWLANNSNWLFSGAGVTAVVVIGTWFTRFLRKRHAGADPTTPRALEARSATEAARVHSIDEAKLKTRILFVDDDIRFKVVSILKKSGWENTRITKDIASLDDPDVAETDIFFVDIQGVGLKLEFRDEGLGLALALKKKYPDKTVVIYSAESHGDRFHEALKQADTSLAKNAEPYEFQQIVEQYATAGQRK